MSTRGQGRQRHTVSTPAQRRLWRFRYYLSRIRRLEALGEQARAQALYGRLEAHAKPGQG